MKRKMTRIVTTLFLVMCLCGNYKTYGFALAGYDTWEELREAAREVGIHVSQGGTYDELSTCPGEETPNNNSSSSINSTQQNDNKPVVKPEQPAHEHSYIETITKEPTCVEEGVTTFTCSCGDKYTEPIDMIEHNYSKRIIVQESTCTVNGKVLISCSVCNDTYEEEMEPLGHENGEWVTTKNPTCTEDGNEMIGCKRCGEQLEERSIEAIGHDDGQWIIAKDDTLFANGLKELRCTTCDEVLKTEVIPINMNTWYIIIGVGSAIVIILTIIGISVKIKKNRKAIK